MICPNCSTEYQTGSCPKCSPGSSEARPESSDNPYAASPIDPSTAQSQVHHNAPQEGDATHGIIPYKNPKALAAYYLGIASGLPLIGLPFGIAAFILGLQGLKARKQNPVVKGSIHAGIGIGCGLIFTLLWSAIIVALLFAAFSAQ